jgi:glycosyltransferase involved in cell wall biosynthesis
METIFAQKYRPVEILIVDDGSTDNTRELVESYGGRVRYHRKDKSTIADTRTVACRLAKGDYIAFQDDDDLMPQDRITRLYDALCKFPQALLAVGEWAVIDMSGKLTGERSLACIQTQNGEPALVKDGYSAVLWPKVTPGPPTTLFRKSDGERIGWFDTRFFHGCSDTDFFARLGKLGPLVYVPGIACYYRKGHNQIWGNTLFGEYSRVLLFEKHLRSLEAGREDLRKRLQLRLLNVLELIAFLRRHGEAMPPPVPSDYLDRVLSLLNGKDRLRYWFYSSVRLPARKAIKG